MSNIKKLIKKKFPAKYPDGGEIDPITGLPVFTPTGNLAGNNWLSTTDGQSPINPSPNDPRQFMRINNEGDPVSSSSPVVPLSQLYDQYTGRFGNQGLRATGQYVGPQGQTTTPDDINAQADQLSLLNRQNSENRERTMDDIEMVSQSSITAINAFLQRNNSGQLSRKNRRDSLMKDTNALLYNPYAEGTGSQAIMKNGGKMKGIKKYPEGGPVPPNNPPTGSYRDPYYEASARLFYFKEQLNNKLKAKNPKAFQDFFGGMKPAMTAEGVKNPAEARRQYIQNSQYNDYLSPDEVKATLGDKYNTYLESIQEVNKYNVAQGLQPLYGDIEGENDVTKLNYGRRFASLQITPSISSALKTNTGDQVTYNRMYNYNPDTNAVDFTESGDMRAKPSYLRPKPVAQTMASLEFGGEVQGANTGVNVLAGGKAKQVSDSDHSFPVIEFIGKEHKDGGIPLEFGGQLAEVENKEVGWVDQEGTLNIFGKLKLPGTNQTFRKAAKDIGEQESKVDRTKSKYLNILNNSDITDPYQQSAQSTAKVMFKSLDKQSKQIAEKKEALASYQNLILSMTEDRPKPKMKYGGKLPKYADGGDLGPTPEELDRLARAIAERESSGNYKIRGKVVTKGMYKGQQALGKYQIMPGNLKQWSKEALGREVTEKEFLDNESIQDQIAKHRMTQIYNRYGTPDDVASVWFTGRPANNAEAGNSTDVNGTSGNEYINDVMGIYQGLRGNSSIIGTTSNAGNNPEPITPLTENGRVNTSDILDYDPVYQPIPGALNTPIDTQYGAAMRNPAPFSDKAKIGVGNRERQFQSPLAVEQIAPELLSIATNQRQGVPMMSYQPDLQQTFDISYQLGRNTNQSTFNQAAQLATQMGSVEAISQLAAQKYQADQAYNVQEVQGNAQQRLQTYAQNTATLNDAQLKNLALQDQQQTKQAQADFNTRLQDMAAFRSISGKVAQNKLENRTYNAYANLFKHYGFDKRGNVTFDPDKVAQRFTAGESQAFGLMAAQQGAQAIMNGDYSRQFTKVKNQDGSTTTTESLGTNKQIQDEYKALQKQGFDDMIIGNILRAKYPQTVTND